MVNLNTGIVCLCTKRQSLIECFRRTLLQSFLLKFYLYVCTKLRPSFVDEADLSAVHPYQRPVSHGQQIIPERPKSQKVVGKSLIHRSAYLQTTGEAKYTDDMPSLPGTLHAALVLSTQPHAQIKNIGIVFFFHLSLSTI